MNKFFRWPSVVATALLFTGLATSPEAKAQHLPCGTDYLIQKAEAANPALRQQREQYLQLISRISARAASGQRQSQGVKKVIPVVVHVIHTFSNNNISDAQIHDMMRVVNEDFSKSAPDTGNIIAAFQPIFANANLEFRLAKLDPDGNCTNGITRTYSTLTNSADDNVKALIRWDPSKYLNIWVVSQISFGAGAYSYLPCTVPGSLEGVVGIHQQFGSIGSSFGSNFAARTITHEIGHYLGLPHIWGMSNTPGIASNCGVNDGIADTPECTGTMGGCNTAKQSCGTLNNVQNLMDYSNCIQMFTLGQAAVMNYSLDSLACRMNLWTPANRVATGTNDGFIASICAPKADFNASNKQICAGNSVTFTDESFNATVDTSWSWAWSFPGGVPATASTPTVTVVYPNPGTYPVSLTVSSSAGNDARTKAAYITAGATATGAPTPLSEGFEYAFFPSHSTDSTLNWSKDSVTINNWQRTTAAAAEGTASMRIRNLQIAIDAVNSLITPNILLNGSSSLTLKFKIAYARRNTSSLDRLRVLVSTDCGQTWQPRYAKSGASLATVPGTGPLNYVPAGPADWREETVALNNLGGASHLLVKFECKSDQGNTLYLDDLQLLGTQLGLAENLTGVTKL
jgi:hypothetical protein